MDKNHSDTGSYSIDSSSKPGDRKIPLNIQVSPADAPILIPKLRIGEPIQPRKPFKLLTMSRSQKLKTCPSEDVLAQARSLKYQSRFGEMLVGASNLQTRLATENSSVGQEMDRSSRALSQNESRILQIQQEFKIKQIECEGLKAHLIMEKAKWQTEKLIQERRLQRQQLEIEELNKKLAQIDRASHSSDSCPSISHATLANTRSLKRFQKVDTNIDSNKRQLTERSRIGEMEERMAKLKEIQIQEKKAAQSLMKIMSQIKGGSKSQRFERKDTAVGTQQTIHQSRGIQCFLNQSTSTTQNIIALKQENSRLKGQFLSTSKVMTGMADQFKQFQSKMEETISMLQNNNKKLEYQKGKLASDLVEKEIEIQGLRMSYNQQIKRQNYSNMCLPPEKQQQIELLEYQTFGLKAKIQELTEINNVLEGKVAEDKIDLQNKITQLYKIVESFESNSNDLTKQKQLLQGKLQQSEKFTQYLEQQLILIRSEVSQNSPKSHIITEILQKTGQETQLFQLRKRVLEQQQQIEQMSRNITELESDLGAKEKELSQYRNRKESKRIQQQLEANKMTITELQKKLVIQQQARHSEMQLSFSKQQEWIDRLADKDIELGRMKEQADSLRRFLEEMQKSSQKLSLSIELLKDNNEKMYQQITNLTNQKCQLEEKLSSMRERNTASTKGSGQRLQRVSSNTVVIVQEDDVSSDHGQSGYQYRQLVVELKGFIKQQGRLCQNLLRDMQKREIVHEINKINDAFQVKLIEINFCSQLKGPTAIQSEFGTKAIQNTQNRSEGQLNKSQASFIKEFLDRSEERVNFNEQVETIVDYVLGKNSEIGVLITKFILTLFHYPNHSYLFEQIQVFVSEARQYEQHIDTKFKKLQKSIGQYLNQANAVLHVEDPSQSSKSITSSQGVKSQDMHLRPVAVHFQGFPTDVKQKRVRFEEEQEPESMSNCHLENSEPNLNDLSSFDLENLQLHSNKPFGKDHSKGTTPNRPVKNDNSRGRRQDEFGRRFSSLK